MSIMTFEKFCNTYGHGEPRVKVYLVLEEPLLGKTCNKSFRYAECKDLTSTCKIPRGLGTLDEIRKALDESFVFQHVFTSLEIHVEDVQALSKIIYESQYLSYLHFSISTPVTLVVYGLTVERYGWVS